MLPVMSPFKRISNLISTNKPLSHLLPMDRFPFDLLAVIAAFDGDSLAIAIGCSCKRLQHLVNERVKMKRVVPYLLVYNASGVRRPLIVGRYLKCSETKHAQRFNPTIEQLQTEFREFKTRIPLPHALRLLVLNMHHFALHPSFEWPPLLTHLHLKNGPRNFVFPETLTHLVLNIKSHEPLTLPRSLRHLDVTGLFEVKSWPLDLKTLILRYKKSVARHLPLPGTLDSLCLFADCRGLSFTWTNITTLGIEYCSDLLRLLSWETDSITTVEYYDAFHFPHDPIPWPPHLKVLKLSSAARFRDPPVPPGVQIQRVLGANKNRGREFNLYYCE
jgi:hypothetical protein